jgi:hypothetical protein
MKTDLAAVLATPVPHYPANAPGIGVAVLLVVVALLIVAFYRRSRRR